MHKQSTNTIMMVRPVRFDFNEQTAITNAFQNVDAMGNSEETQQKALAEFESMVTLLKQNGVNVWVVDDTPTPHTPDSIFPNNWISFHQDGQVILYPMCAENRRLERRTDILEGLKKNFTVSAVTDLSYFEQENIFLEGTGSLILDRPNMIAYACYSPRTHESVLEVFAQKTGYKVVGFTARDASGMLIYHTNVMMCVGDKFAVICLESLQDKAEQEMMLNQLRSTSKEVIDISFDQMNQFAGNMLQVYNDKGDTLLVMSDRAYRSLTASQIQRLEKYATLVHPVLTVIEDNGGGSARCMMAEVFLPTIN
ncbi:MAG: amidinotransferase [Cytophagales bacterium]|nr:MAG: amidinotransferase [Cytophagales bacterium]